MKKSWVIPDIHGCKQTLQALIELQIKPNKLDELYFLGDFIDRGPDSKGVLDYIMHLIQQEYQVQYLKGNHEDYCIRAWEEDQSKNNFFGLRRKGKVQKVWETHGGEETLSSFGVKYASEIPEQYIAWMKKGHYYIELDRYILVHAGLNFNIDDPLADTFSMLWTREFNVVPQKIRNKKVIHGHVPVDLEFMHHVMQSAGYNFVALDNGVYMDSTTGYGNLVAFELHSRELLIQTNLDY